MTFKTNELRDKLKTIIDYVRECEARTARGEILDMSSLDQTVSDICAEIVDLPRSESRDLEPSMQSLVKALDSLAVTMREAHGKIAAGAGG